MNLFEVDLLPMQAILEWNLYIPRELLNEVGCSLGSCNKEVTPLIWTMLALSKIDTNKPASIC